MSKSQSQLSLTDMLQLSNKYEHMTPIINELRFRT